MRVISSVTGEKGLRMITLSALYRDILGHCDESAGNSRHYAKLLFLEQMSKSFSFSSIAFGFQLSSSVVFLSTLAQIMLTFV